MIKDDSYTELNSKCSGHCGICQWKCDTHLINKGYNELEVRTNATQFSDPAAWIWFNVLPSLSYRHPQIV